MTLGLRVKFPWWTKAYIGWLCLHVRLLALCAVLGFPVNLDPAVNRAVRRIIHHTKFECYS